MSAAPRVRATMPWNLLMLPSMAGALAGPLSPRGTAFAALGLARPRRPPSWRPGQPAQPERQQAPAARSPPVAAGCLGRLWAVTARRQWVSAGQRRSTSDGASPQVRGAFRAISAGHGPVRWHACHIPLQRVKVIRCAGRGPETRRWSAHGLQYSAALRPAGRPRPSGAVLATAG